MLKFPPLIEYQITQVRNFEIALSKLVDNCADVLYKHPYLINLFDLPEISTDFCQCLFLVDEHRPKLNHLK